MIRIIWIKSVGHNEGEEIPDVGHGEKTLKLTYNSYHKLKTKEKLGCHRSDRIEE
jgi:hypothetical protein